MPAIGRKARNNLIPPTLLNESQGKLIKHQLVREAEGKRVDEREGGRGAY